jgi:hypothetical protein
LYANVISNSSGAEYSVSIKTNCDCKAYSIKDFIGAKPCSHIMNVLIKMLEKGGIVIMKNIVVDRDGTVSRMCERCRITKECYKVKTQKGTEDHPEWEDGFICIECVKQLIEIPKLLRE